MRSPRKAVSIHNNQPVGWQTTRTIRHAGGLIAQRTARQDIRYRWLVVSEFVQFFQLLPVDQQLEQTRKPGNGLSSLDRGSTARRYPHQAAVLKVTALCFCLTLTPINAEAPQCGVSKRVTHLPLKAVPGSEGRTGNINILAIDPEANYRFNYTPIFAASQWENTKKGRIWRESPSEDRRERIARAARACQSVLSGASPSRSAILTGSPVSMLVAAATPISIESAPSR